MKNEDEIAAEEEARAKENSREKDAGKEHARKEEGAGGKEHEVNGFDFVGHQALERVECRPV